MHPPTLHVCPISAGMKHVCCVKVSVTFYVLVTTHVVVNCDNAMPVSKIQFASYVETQNFNFEIILQYYTIDMANIIMK
jgi:hypothetical protein